jgi:hypothetical protein
MDMYERSVARLEGHVVSAALALRRAYFAAPEEERIYPLLNRALEEAVTGLLDAADDLAELLCERP